jgi:hypothetical protein
MGQKDHGNRLQQTPGDVSTELDLCFFEREEYGPALLYLLNLAKIGLRHSQSTAWL